MSPDPATPHVLADAPSHCGPGRPSSQPPLDGPPRSFARVLPSRPLGVQGPVGPAPVGPAGRGPGRPPRTADDDGLLALVRRFVLLYLEVEAGRRELRQLAGLITPRLALRLSGAAGGGGVAGRLHHVAGVRSRPDSFDAVAVVRRGDRYGALAVRVVARRGHWLVDQAWRPEDAPYSVRSAPGPMAGRACTR